MIHYSLKSPNISPNGEMAKLPYHLKSGFSAQLDNRNFTLGMLLLHGLKGKTTHHDQNIGFIILHCLPCIKMAVYPPAWAIDFKETTNKFSTFYPDPNSHLNTLHVIVEDPWAVKLKKHQILGVPINCPPSLIAQTKKFKCHRAVSRRRRNFIETN